MHSKFRLVSLYSSHMNLLSSSIGLCVAIHMRVAILTSYNMCYSCSRLLPSAQARARLDDINHIRSVLLLLAKCGDIYSSPSLFKYSCIPILDRTFHINLNNSKNNDNINICPVQVILIFYYCKYFLYL